MIHTGTMSSGFIKSVEFSESGGEGTYVNEVDEGVADAGPVSSCKSRMETIQLTCNHC